MQDSITIQYRGRGPDGAFGLQRVKFTGPEAGIIRAIAADQREGMASTVHGVDALVMARFADKLKALGLSLTGTGTAYRLDPEVAIIEDRPAATDANTPIKAQPEPKARVYENPKDFHRFVMVDGQRREVPVKDVDFLKNLHRRGAEGISWNVVYRDLQADADRLAGYGVKTRIQAGNVRAHDALILESRVEFTS